MNFFSLIEILNEMDVITPDSFILKISNVIMELKNEKKTKNLSENLKLRESVGLSFLSCYIEKCSNNYSFLKMIETLNLLLLNFNSNQQDLFNLGMLLNIIYQFIKRCSIKELEKEKKFKENIIKLFDNSILLSTKETILKQKLIKKENLKLNENDFKYFDISTQMFKFISIMLPLIGNEIFDEKDFQILLNLILQNLISILKFHNLQNMYKTKFILKIILNFNYFSTNQNREILNLFYDSQFFFIDNDSFKYWKEILNRIMKKEKNFYFIELLNKFNSTQSIFMSAESEAISKSRLLKRMSFIIYSGEFNQYLNHFNLIIDKIVDSLKSSNSNTVLFQILLSLRVLMLKISNQNLKSIWPTIMTLIIRVLENSKNEHPSILFAICRFIDYATIILPEDFQFYKWIFYTK